MKFSVVGMKENNEKSQSPKVDYYKEADGVRELNECVLEAFMYGATKVIINRKART